MELVAIALIIAAGAALHALEGVIAALGEVRLLDSVEAGGRDGKTAKRLLDEAAGRRTRLLAGRAASLVAAVGLTAHVVGPRAPIWVTVAALCGVGALYAVIAIGLDAVARARAVDWALPMARWLRPIELAVLPLALPLHPIYSLLHKRFSPPQSSEPSDDDHALREVEHMIEKREESGSLTEEFAELLLSVLEFKDTVAREIMVPRTQVMALNLDATLDEAIEMIEEHGHSRYPVFRDRLDQIEGILYAKDLFRILRAGEELESLRAIIRRPAFFVAETQKIGQLLREMQARRFHLAVVVDEFGGTSGIVTLEDIVEEIVGEIRDEHDADELPIEEVSPGTWWVDASVSVYDLARELDVEFDTDAGDFDSVGGMIVETAGRVPSEGESVAFGGFTFIVREADERHVTRVEVLAQPTTADDPEHAAAE